MLYACVDVKTALLKKYHYVLYFLVLAMQVCLVIHSLSLSYILRQPKQYFVATAENVVDRG